MNHTWPSLLNTLLAREALAPEQTSWAMSRIMAGDATPVQIAAFAMALRSKGETAAEISGLVAGMLAAATPIDVSPDAVDIVGTGGDQAHTVNISTMAAIVVAGAGIPVVKHGNRAASSSTGAADLLEYLGVPISMTPELASVCVREAGIAFCFAPIYHPGMRHAGVPRKEMGVPTFFNFLGPLTNPGRVRASAVGCANLRMAPVMAEVFAQRGASAVVMRGEDGLDEFTTTAPTRLWVVADGSVTETVLDAADLGIPRAAREDLRGADAAFNAKVARSVLAGDRGPVRDAVVLNAAAGIAAYDGFSGGLEASLRAGLEKAATSIDSGSAGTALDRWIAVATQG
ncbi:anthranilate phosphoribosyltransferase [Cryptosporangium arvum]|uniref:Anthranilate phosphoribosyltransferase n=1 Tax=Cryptosporangium arvum DSM 44712 TaxID=927661 RepID=A0A010ZQB7_9ACTN|nr:anthranilate phosphoribosyltransferase [Cryptosporangium arvum]EXG80864.1 anthranilate phosphoribosyltransferase [Cryptosporangium arvum DSM 44712]